MSELNRININKNNPIDLYNQARHQYSKGDWSSLTTLDKVINVCIPVLGWIKLITSYLAHHSATKRLKNLLRSSADIEIKGTHLTNLFNAVKNNDVETFKELHRNHNNRRGFIESAINEGDIDTAKCYIDLSLKENPKFLTALNKGITLIDFALQKSTESYIISGENSKEYEIYQNLYTYLVRQKNKLECAKENFEIDVSRPLVELVETTIQSDDAATLKLILQRMTKDVAREILLSTHFSNMHPINFAIKNKKIKCTNALIQAAKDKNLYSEVLKLPLS
ncbi:MAG: hypothetical protein COT85_00755 [Chlamydiae bacterium CG10_big_fil_rev_8_21_14_0_10_42_34]|nr:MAG: hypothetical protein COT85_00755 [Chlamydiae bacterium CG10_big_fil_rev_8_21_14_0_10_42_34]